MLSRSLCFEVWHDVIFGRGHVTRLDRMKRGSGIKGRDEDQVYRSTVRYNFCFFSPVFEARQARHSLESSDLISKQGQKKTKLYLAFFFILLQINFYSGSLYP